MSPPGSATGACRAPQPRTLLFLTSRYPPAGGPGAIRASKTVKYLRRFGWQSVVITSDRVGAAMDAADCRDDEARALEVYRIGIPSPSEYVRRIDNVLHVASTATRHVGYPLDRLRRGLAWRCERLRERVTAPDSGIWRLARVVRLARQLHQRYRFDAILSSGMPFSDHLIGSAVQLLIRRPWVAEFRDPWVEYAHAPQWRSPAGRRVVETLEAWVIRRAQAVVSVSDEMTARYAQRYWNQPAGKFVTVMNGFDPADLAGAGPSQDLSQSNFTLLHAGSFYGPRSPASLMSAFRQFVGGHPKRQTCVRLLLAGRLGPYESMVRDASRELPIEITGSIPHIEALRRMREAGVNLLILPGGDGTNGDVSSKVFEYLAAGRAILAATTADSAAASLLKGQPGAWRVEPDDTLGLVRIMETLFAMWRDGELLDYRGSRNLAALTREHQTGRLADVLARMTRSWRAAPHGSASARRPSPFVASAGMARPERAKLGYVCSSTSDMPEANAWDRVPRIDRENSELAEVGAA